MARRSRIADESTTGTQFSVNCKTYFHIKVAARSRARASERAHSIVATVARVTLSSPRYRCFSDSHYHSFSTWRTGGPGPILQSRSTCTGGGERGERVGCKTPTVPGGVPFPSYHHVAAYAVRSELRPGTFAENETESAGRNERGPHCVARPAMDFHSGNTPTARTPARLKSLFTAIIVTLCSQDPLRSDANEIVLQHRDRET